MRARRLLNCAALALLSATPATADHWVSIGAFRAAQSATTLAIDASAKLELPFQALVVRTSDQGQLHRVAAGPFGSLKEAIAQANRARQGGFADAWVLQINAPEVASEPLDVDLSAQTGASIALPDDWDGELPSIEMLLQGLPDLPATPVAPPALPEPVPGDDEEEEVVVPDGYKLHKLNRDSALRVPFEPETDRLGAFDARLKWYSSARLLPADDALRESTGDATPIDHNADLRMMWHKRTGPWRLLIEHSTTWIRSDAAAGSPGLTFDQTPTGDERRVMNLTWPIEDRADRRLLHRLDRLALEYRTPHWAISAGRQALSWGGGLVFQPMDLFNPFAPTTVDQDYKAGDDLILFERVFGSGADLQLLAVGRRSEAETVDLDASSIAGKYRAVVGDNELELMAANHYGGQVYGLGLRVPAGGALVRSDLTWTVDDDEVVLSGVLNADYTFGVAGTIVHVFGEYYHNGFGVNTLPDDLRDLPIALVRRIARGELFNLMRNYFALGTAFRWHFLLNQSIALIANLHDRSLAAQASLTYDASDASRLQVGVTKPFGGAGEEFGGLTVGDGLTVGGGEQGFLRFVYFF